MIVNPKILTELRDAAGTIRKEKAEEYVNKKRVTIKKVIYENINNFEIRSKVKENEDIYNVHIKVEKGEIEDISCDCLDYHEHYATCTNILASTIEFESNENYIRIFSGEKEEKQSDVEIYKKYQNKKEKYRNFKQLINTFNKTHQEIEKEKKKQ